MSVTAENIVQVVDALTSHPWFSRSGARFLPVAEARFHEVDPGTLTWDWCGRHAAERGLRGAVAYYDLDGQIVSIMVMVADDHVTEIELWRGDGTAILALPQPSDL
jgi:hypothetical protein